MLVNAVEKMDDEKAALYEREDSELLKTFNMNTLPMVYMTRILGSHFKRRTASAPTKKCAIINMTSIYVEKGVERAPIFCAGKSF